MIFAALALALLAGSSAATYAPPPPERECVTLAGQPNAFCFEKTYTVDRETMNLLVSQLYGETMIHGNLATAEADAEALGSNTLTDAQSYSFTAQPGALGYYAPGYSASGATSSSGSSGYYY